MMMEEEGPFDGKLKIKQVEHLLIALEQIIFVCDLYNLKILKSAFFSCPHINVTQRLTVENLVMLLVM